MRQGRPSRRCGVARGIPTRSGRGDFPGARARCLMGRLPPGVATGDAVPMRAILA
ncbi:hypothetical protein C7S16_6592 [Burkholderia thailandensis]|uniref:Uncharacterized protein n=1 Tax=Burkholderia thailandensis TaxID=57975 RepID=A0AAW9CS76_BURTH|nr:hypothetical protein [Burkholderia thailandensis]MDW9253475.1 hypothetical protein [Burkholderia thailandensis]